MSRQRECVNPAPQNGGKPCAGDAVDYEGCNKQPCPLGKPKPCAAVPTNVILHAG